MPRPNLLGLLGDGAEEEGAPAPTPPGVGRGRHREAGRRGRRPALERTLERTDSWSWPRRWWAFRDFRRAFGWRFWVSATGGATLSRGTPATLDDPSRGRPDGGRIGA